MQNVKEGLFNNLINDEEAVEFVEVVKRTLKEKSPYPNKNNVTIEFDQWEMYEGLPALEYTESINGYSQIRKVKLQPFVNEFLNWKLETSSSNTLCRLTHKSALRMTPEEKECWQKNKTK